MKKHVNIAVLGMEGSLALLAPLPLLFISREINPDVNLIEIILAILTSAFCFYSSGVIVKSLPIGKFFSIATLIGCYVLGYPFFFADQSRVLFFSVVFIFALFYLYDLEDLSVYRHDFNEVKVALNRMLGAGLFLPVLGLLCAMLHGSRDFYLHAVLTSSFLIFLLLIFFWVIKTRYKLCGIFPLLLISIILYGLLVNRHDYVLLLIESISIFSLVLFVAGRIYRRKFNKWMFLINHPARILLTTFLGLCLFGTALLLLPISTTSGSIAFVDAVFTSVSAVCVTGLTVMDTSKDFTLFGQFSILLLIQLGGLGIMTITSVALHVMGKRLSLKHERILTSMTDTEDNDLVHSLFLILKFTVVVESIGAILLSLLFYSESYDVSHSIWNGVFTSISAFCNAGFALQSSSLVPFQNNFLVLGVISTLIVVGGTAPVTVLIIPRWLKRKKISISSQIALITTIVLLFSGTLSFLVFEWDGVLANFSMFDKVSNAWFQSVTFRTAGFNSVDISKLTDITFLVAIFLMFVGGNPGGTAGGIKTLTLGVVAMTFWACITNRKDVIINSKKIAPAIVFRAITIVIAGMVMWFSLLLMLLATQQIPLRDLIFELTSALGTVGLSLGATASLDEIGKAIIIIAMFIGRIGPVTIFMILDDGSNQSTDQYPDAKISLT